MVKHQKPPCVGGIFANSCIPVKGGSMKRRQLSIKRSIPMKLIA